MAKITLDDITSNYASVVQLNARFQLIEDQLNNAVFYRVNPVGEPNSLQNDMDMNSNDILNCNTLYTTKLNLGGVDVSANGVYPTSSATIYLNSGQTVVDAGFDIQFATLNVSGPDVDGERLVPDVDYTINGTLITLTNSYPANTILSIVTYQEDINDEGDAYGPTLTESITLTSGQTSVVFTSPLSTGSFYLSGDDVDNGRLLDGVDYTVDVAAKTLVLNQSYPAGTIVTLIREAGTDASLINLINNFNLYIRKPATPATGELLQYNGTDWINVAGGAATGELLQYNGTSWTSVAGGATTGQYLQFNGTNWAPVTLSSKKNVVVTSVGVTAAHNDLIVVDTATQTITLPASPTAGDEVSISVGNFTDTVVARNGSNIMGDASDLTLDTAYAGVTLVYSDATNGWRLI